MIEALRLRERTRSATGVLRSLPRVFRILLAAAPKQTWALLILTLLSGLIPVALLAITKPTVDAVASIVRGEISDWSQPVWLALAVLLLILLSEALTSLTAWIRLGHSDLVGTHVRGLAQDQSSRVSMSFYEQPDYFDLLHRAREAASERPVQLIDGLTGLGRTLIALSGVTLILFSYAWWLPLLLAVAMLPALASGLGYALRHHRLEMENTLRERYAWYFDWLLTARSAAAEMRVFGLAAHFQARYRQVREQLRTAMLRLHGREALVQLALAILGLAAAAGALMWMLAAAMRGEASLGDVALCYQAFVQGSGLMRTAISSLSSVYRNSLFLGDFFRFLDLPADPIAQESDAQDEIAAPRRGPATGEPLRAPAIQALAIRFDKVSFRYPGFRTAALDELDLRIEAGSVVAILGPNGAGKSTLVKLLCRFYEPDSGVLSLGERDARTIPVHELRKQVSVLFQELLEYSGTLAENVLPLAPENHERIQAGLRAACAERLVEGLPDGMTTRLGTWFPGGTDLSGGEWQRIAMARAFAREAPILVLDEPTSAMDPWAERDWLRALRSHVQGRTVILITHRLTTAREADCIHVMEQGRILESGTHAELIAAGQAYASLWASRSLHAESTDLLAASAPAEP